MMIVMLVRRDIPEVNKKNKYQEVVNDAKTGAGIEIIMTNINIMEIIISGLSEKRA